MCVLSLPPALQHMDDLKLAMQMLNLRGEVL
jgi:hypothetical protein